MGARTGVFKVVVVLATLCALEALLCVHLALRAREATGGGAGDRGRDAALVETMVAATSGIYDSHPDADVSRVLLPGVKDRPAEGGVRSSNRFGMPEREYEPAKPEGVTRIVLLGDSFVFGVGVEPGERFGVHLERFLAERAGDAVLTPEVLHLGISSWNLVAECAFVRRQLGLLRPDLVVHVSYLNDVADTSGVRGFGAMARHVPRAPGQADAVLRPAHAHWAVLRGASGHLARGLDHESRTRFGEAAAHVARLAREVERAGGRYLHVFNWSRMNPVAARFVAAGLRPDQTAWIPLSFATAPETRVARGDPHWNPAGHEVMARFLYGLIVERSLLPALRPAPWEEAASLARRLDGEGREEAASPGVLRRLTEELDLPSAFDVRALTRESASLVHGGIDAEGLVSPYASLMLGTLEGGTLRIQGRCLDRPELDGGVVEVFVDERLVTTFPLRAGAAIDLEAPLPRELAGRPAVSVRFAADDFAYVGPDLRRCVSFALQRVSIEP